MVALLGLVGCGESSNQESTSTNADTTAQTAPAQPAQETPAPSTVPANAPVLKVAASGNLPPFEYLDEKGNPIGIEVDIIRAIGENQGFKVELYQESFSDLMTTLEEGKYHATISHSVSTPERALRFDHTQPYFTDPNIILFNPSLPITDINSLKPYRVASLRNSTHEKFAKDMGFASHETEQTTFQLISGLAQGKYDAVLTKKYMAEHILKGHPQFMPKSVEFDDGTSNDIVMRVKKGDKETLDKLNAGIAHLKASGEIDNIASKYLTVPSK